MLSTEVTFHLIPRYAGPHKLFLLRHHCRRHHNPVKQQRAFITYNNVNSSSSSSSSSSSTLQPLSDEMNDKVLAEWETIPLPAVTAAKRVVLVRHGQSTWNAEGRIQGSSDYSVLTPKGESQAQTSRLMLLHDSFHVCFSSPLNRSKRTAEIIWGSRKDEILTDSNLREIDLYSFQGLLKNEGKDRYGATFRQWQIDAPNFCIDGHYPVRELWSRARSCWTKILSHESKSILVVAHNAVNQALIATAIGLGTEYFRVLLQSNCGVSVLDFTPKPEGGLPDICVNRLNQTPSSPFAGGSSTGRKANIRIILVCHGCPQIELEGSVSFSGESRMNMLGSIQAQKTAEALLDVKVNNVISSNTVASVETANVISRMQEAAECLGADCVPRYAKLKQIQDLDVGHILKKTSQELRRLEANESGWLKGLEEEIKTSLWDQSGKAWKSLVDEVAKGEESEKNLVAVGHPALHIAMIGHCLNLSKEWVGSFHLDPGSISVIDFPDGPQGTSVISCTNYTAHLGRWSIPVTQPTNYS